MALKRDIEVDDLPIVPDYSRGKLWNIKLNRHRKSSTFWTLMSLAKYELLFVIFCSILIGGLKVRRFLFFRYDDLRIVVYAKASSFL